MPDTEIAIMISPSYRVVARSGVIHLRRLLGMLSPTGELGIMPTYAVSPLFSRVPQEITAS